MIHHTVDGGKSSPGGQAGRRPRPRRRWTATILAGTACLLGALGGTASAQPAVVPPPALTGPVETRSAPTPPPAPLAQPGGTIRPVTPPPPPPSGVFADAPPATGAAAQPPVLQPPRPVPPFGPDQVRLPLLAGPAPVGLPPKPTAAAQAKASAYIDNLARAELTMELANGQTTIVNLKEIPKRIQIANEGVATYTVITPKTLSVLGNNVGSTVMNIWFADKADPTKEVLLSYLVNVVPDPSCECRLQRVYKKLEEEINKALPDSRVNLYLVGDQLLVCGQAKDIAEAEYILELVRGNALPGRMTIGERAATIPLNQLHQGEQPPVDGVLPAALENYQVSGGPRIVNMLKVTGGQQVSLQVTVAEVNRAAARAIGLNFNIFNNDGALVVGNTTGQIISPFAPIGNFARFASVTGFQRGLYQNLPVAVDNGQIQLAISALRELNYARMLVEPTLTTMNGHTANLQAGGLFPVPFLTGTAFGGGLQGVGFIPTGAQLSFTPYITDRDRIRLVINAEVSERDLTLGETLINGSAVPSLVTRNFSTTVELREGQTLAVAGLIQNRLGATSSRVPFFGDLPIIGRLASFDRIHAQEQELVVLVTPQLVYPMEPKQIPPLPGSDIFEPGDCEFYLLGRIESRRPYDYRSPVRTDINRMARYKHCEDIYITGPTGCSGPWCGH